MNSDEDLDNDKACAKDISSCKSDNTKRQNFCNRITLNKDDDKTWGDGKLLKVTLETINSSNSSNADTPPNSNTGNTTSDSKPTRLLKDWDSINNE